MSVAFERTVNLFISRTVAPEAAKAYLIKRARSGLAEFMARQSVRPMVEIETDGNPSNTEDTVRPFGVIVYRFSRMREIVSFALRELERLSPVRSGRYRRSWITIEGVEETGLDMITGRSQVTIVNTQPYHRKIQVGARGFVAYANPGIVEKVRQLIIRRYRGAVVPNIRFIALANGYILKKGRRAGQQLTYPALVLDPF